jgi:outer membrane protein assembly factor BamA
MCALSRLLLLTMALALPITSGAQEAVPGETDPATQLPEQERVVEGRPPLYSIKRNAHPLTWIEKAFKPVLRYAPSKLQKTGGGKTGHIRLGVTGNGTGSGFGPQVTFVEENLLGRGIEVQIPLLYTYKRYQLAEFKASVPVGSQSVKHAVKFDLGAGYGSRAMDNFFGIGNDSNIDDETRFRTVTRSGSAGLSFTLNDQWKSGVHAVYQNIGVTKPVAGTSAQDHFEAATTPGLSGAALASAVFSIGRDSVLRDNTSFKGASDYFEVSFNRSPGGGEFQYWRQRLLSQHFFPLTDDGRKVIATRALLELNQTASGRSIPFFEMPVLGSGDTIRGFEDLRFRDKNAVALTIEYRYRIWPALDFGLFVDEGQVAPRVADLSLARFHTGYGARLFVWPKQNLPISFDIGRSAEKWRLYLGFNTKF